MHDYIIIGAGMAGLKLALAMMEDDYFSGKKVLILDESNKRENDKTWCFWEIERERGKGKRQTLLKEGRGTRDEGRGVREDRGEGRGERSDDIMAWRAMKGGEGRTSPSWDCVVSKSWQKAYFHSDRFSRKLDLAPYRYKMVHSIDFYNYAMGKVRDHPDFEFKNEKVLRVEEGNMQMVHTLSGSYGAGHVFDSRVENPENDQSPLILQHFKGWFIRTEDRVFDPDSFTMMDFRLRWKNSCSFTYILPTSPNEALLEFTFFNREKVTDDVYERMLKAYLKEYLNAPVYEVTETEKGVIPMTTMPFHNRSTANITKIGTAGSWVKPSTGYSFKHADKYIGKIIDNIKEGRIPSQDLLLPKYRWYDSLFINVLYENNELGPKLFELMYKKNKVQKIFKFLDEETHLLEDVRIMNSFPKIPFLKALFGIKN